MCDVGHVNVCNSLFESNYYRIEILWVYGIVNNSDLFESNYYRIEINLWWIARFARQSLNRTIIGLKSYRLYHSQGQEISLNRTIIGLKL